MDDSKQANYKFKGFSSTTESIKSEHKDVGANENNKIDKEETTFSIFNEGACGEPCRTQHLIIDFTPTEQDECDVLLKKCCDFFDYINSRNELVQMKVKPDPAFENKVDFSESELTISSVSSIEQPLPTHILARSAVSVLEMVEKDDLIKRAFEAKMPQSKCSLGLEDYSVNDYGLKKFPKVCTCDATCPKCKKKPLKKKKMIAPYTADAINLCRNLDNWDEQHPKQMESPVGPPSLINAVLQRIEPAD
ncbi:uncharacterized protein LOC113229119 [Hyposmocoma kahamanoa]|uniref:uncharacterized protein LOC113229119 n=1 Tax=Hyposmocoma kahamanoa TaxID=1477025 RepID=UPI000E6D6813|nr:uncharacterized protein LOC113229119 [Hyposmocoma kahamanoa]